MMFDKLLHFLGGATLSIPLKQSLLAGFLCGVVVELFGIVTQMGTFDLWDILATGMGGVAIYMWRKKIKK